eukprot:3135251-Pyramimonas_sp.AAC.1
MDAQIRVAGRSLAAHYYAHTAVLNIENALHKISKPVSECSEPGSKHSYVKLGDLCRVFD